MSVSSDGNATLLEAYISNREARASISFFPNLGKEPCGQVRRRLNGGVGFTGLLRNSMSDSDHLWDVP
jgi:hypothetical protein